MTYNPLDKAISDAVDKQVGYQVQQWERRKFWGWMKKRKNAKKHGANYWEE